MARTAQILLLLVIVVAVQSYDGRHHSRGRYHGRYHNPYNYYHHRSHGDVSPHEKKYMKRLISYHQKNSKNPGDQLVDDPPQKLRVPAVPINSPLSGFDPNNGEDLKSVKSESTTTELPPISYPVPNSNSAPLDDANPDSDSSASNPGLDLTGAVNNDKPDDVANVQLNGLSTGIEEPERISGNINGNGSSLGDNTSGSINVNGMSSTVSNELPEGDGSINVNGLSPSINENKPNLDDNLGGNLNGYEDNNLGSNLDGKIEGDLGGDLNGNVGGNIHGNLDHNVAGILDGNIGGNLPNINLGNPSGSINVNGLEPGKIGEPLSVGNHDKLDHGNINDDSINNGQSPNSNQRPDKDKPGSNGNTIHIDGFSSNGDDDNKNVNGLSPGVDNNKLNDGDNTININGLSPEGDDKNSGQSSINVDGLSPGGDNGKPHNNNININGLSPGGDDVNADGNDDHGGLPSDDLGKPNHNNVDAQKLEPDHNNHDDHPIYKPNISNNDGLPSGVGSIGAHVNLPEITSHITDNGGLHLEAKPELTGHIIDHSGLKPTVNPDLSAHDINWSYIHPTFPGNDIIPDSRPMPDIHGRPDDIPSIEIPDQLGNKDEDGKRNHSMIPVLLPGGGNILVHPSVLSKIPSYVIVMINGQPTLIQSPGGIGSENGGSLDLSKLIFGNGQPIGGMNIHGGTVLPNWLNLGGIGGNSGAAIGVLPNIQQPIWISSHLPNYGDGGATGGSFLIPNNEPVEPVPVPIPVPRPVSPPQPIYPIPEPIDPGFTVNPGDLWPPLWNTNPSNPNVNLNFTHIPLMPNPGSNIDWKKLIDLLVNLGSHLSKPQPQPTTPPQTNRQPPPTPQPSYPSYPYPQYPYPYPPPYPYLPYPYPTYPYPGKKPTGSGKHVPNDGSSISHDKDTPNSNDQPYVKPEPHPEPRPEPQPDVPIQPQPEPRPEPQPDVSVEPRPEPHPDISRENRPEPRPEPHPVPQPDNTLEPNREPGPDVTLEPRPEPSVPLEPQPKPLPSVPVEPRPEPQPNVPVEPRPEPQPDVPVEPRPEPHPDISRETRPEPRPEPRPVPQPDNTLEPNREPGPDVTLEPRPEPSVPLRPQPKPRPNVLVEPHPEPQPDVPVEPRPEPQPHIPIEPQPKPRPNVPVEPHPEPQPNVPVEPLPEPHPDISQETRPEPRPEPRPVPQPDNTLEPNREPGPDVTLEPRPEPSVPLEPQPKPCPEPYPKPRPDHPENRPRPNYDRPAINLPDIHITLPKPTNIGKLKPGQPGLDSGLIDILNILLKFPDGNSHPPKNLGPLIKLLLAILKPGDKNKPLIPNLNEDIKGQPDLGNLGHILLQLLNGQKKPNLNVLVEPGMDENTRANLILLLKLLANNLGGSYNGMEYYQPENPLLYFLGHFPCDHPNIQAISGMQSNSNLWQLLANMYGHNFDRSELRLERSAEETDDKPAEAVDKSKKK